MNFKENHLVTLTNEKLTQLGYNNQTIFEILSIEGDSIEIKNAKRILGDPFCLSVNDIKGIEIDSDLARKLGMQLTPMADIVGDKEYGTKRNPSDYFVITAEQIKFECFKICASSSRFIKRNKTGTLS